MANVTPPNAGKGRKLGSQNTFTKEAKQAFALAFEGIGGVAKLTEWAQENLTEFFKLYARLIPVEVAGSLEVKRSEADYTDAELAAIAGRSSRLVADSQRGPVRPN